VWTAEMLMIFSLCRPDVLSWGDLGIRRGMALLYGDRELTRERFERRRKRYSPYGSVVSLYLWSIAGMEEALAVKLPRG
ncbi:MAG: DNA repair protein, partial [Bilophila wadsworthia]